MAKEPKGNREVRIPANSFPKYKCSNPKCGHTWVPRKPNPIYCPKCHHKWKGEVDA